jgi:hypothetical protein
MPWNRLSPLMLAMARLAMFLASIATPGAVLAQSLQILPAEVLLTSPESSDQVVVLLQAPDGSVRDVTRTARLTLSDPALAMVSATGRIEPLRDGRLQLTAEAGGLMAQATVVVSGTVAPKPVSFRHDILPLLTRAGCNSGGCHGKAAGQNGFKLSVFGYDAAADHAAIVSEGRGRRIFPAAPEHSLFLRKATAAMPHGGGLKVPADGRWHRLLLRWMHEGMQLDPETADPVAELIVEPAAVSMTARDSRQLRVVAKLHDGTLRPVTAEAEYQSNQDVIATVDREGLTTTADVPGEAAILVRYAGHVAVCRITRPRESGDFTRPPERNFIDKLVWDKLQQLRITPSPPADDAAFLRRASLDITGTLPTASEARGFLTDASPDKRRQLVDRLLQSPAYADFWAQRWADLLQVDKDTVSPEGTVAMTRWIHSQFRRNVPFDQFARSVLTVKGSTYSESPAAFHLVQDTPEKLARSVSQLFLGVRIECAQCHHHPFERWDQQDYFAFAGAFTGIERKPDPRGGTRILARTATPLKHPRTGLEVPPAPPGGPAFTLQPGSDIRRQLADWATAPQNPWFARTLANRLWAHYFGRGLVEPIDDLRATNPASNEPLLQALAQHLVDVKYDIHAFTRTLLDSQAWQLSSTLNESNLLDDQNASHALWKPLPAEVLLDAVSQVTEIPEVFNGWPVGYRAIQIWDNKLPSPFMEVFGRPQRQTVCACERGSEPSIAQALHLMNSPGTMEKIQHGRGRAARLAGSGTSNAEIIDELYLTALSRFPTTEERTLMLNALQSSSDHRAAIEDIIWVLLNSREFVFCR